MLQLQKGGYLDNLLQNTEPKFLEAMLEIDAKTELIRNARKWKIPYDELQDVIESRAGWVQKYKELGGDPNVISLLY